jgi:molybdate transport system substrate-binding protein
MARLSSNLVGPAVLAALVCGVVLPGCRKQDHKELKVYAAAGLQPVLGNLAAEFKKQTGVEVVLDYGGSGMIISRARLDPEADLFMPGDRWYVDQLQQQSGLIESQTTIGYFVPVIIVRKDCPKDIRRLEDLFDPNVKVGLGNPDACQVGRTSKELLAKNNLDYSRLSPKLSVTVNELGAWVKLRDVDAAIVWDAIAAGIRDSVRIIEIPKDRNCFSEVSVGLMKTSAHKVEARQFIELMTSPAGQALLNAGGLRTTPP